MLRKSRQFRQGKLLLWVAGLLLLVVLGYLGFRWYLQRPEYDPHLFEEFTRRKLEQERQRSGDWPGWRGQYRDGVARDEKFSTDWPAGGLNRLWEIALGAGYSSMAVADGKVVTLYQDGPNEVVGCWDAETGKELWKDAYPARFDSDQGSGPRSTPQIDGDRVFAVGATGVIRCLSLASGKVLWKRNLAEDFAASPPRWGVSFSPLVIDGKVIVHPGGKGASVAALSRENGDILWKSQDDPAGYSSPIAFESHGVKQILMFTGTHLIGLNPDNGALHWRFEWKTDHRANVATPLLFPDHVFISSGYGKGCALVRVDRDGDKLTVKQVFKNKALHNHFSSSIYHRDHVYGFDEGFLVCLPLKVDPKEKMKPLWKERKFRKGTLLLIGDHLVILGEQGLLGLAEASPEEYREKASFQATEGKCWSAVVLAHGRIYVRDENRLLCFDARKK